MDNTYTKNTWQNGDVVNKDKLDRMESGIKYACDSADVLIPKVSAMDSMTSSIDITEYDSTTCTVSANNTLTRSGSKYKSRQIPLVGQYKYLLVEASQTYSSNVTFLTTKLETTPTSGTDISDYLASGEEGRHIISAGTTELLLIPSDCTNIVIAYVSNNSDATPSSVKALTNVAQKISTVENQVAQKMGAFDNQTINWGTSFGTEAYPLGWRTGYYSKSNGGSASSNNAIRTNNAYYYVAKTGETNISFTVPEACHAQISEYDSNKTFVRTIGDHETGDYTVSADLTEGHMYRFSVGGFSGNAADYLKLMFIGTLICVVKKSVRSIIDEQDRRITMLEQGEQDIPDYYFADGYLQSKIDAITDVQNSIGALQDSFFFISDTHHQYNEGHSYALLNYISKRTGIKKLFHGGDSGGSYGSSESAVYHRLQRSAQAWNDYADAVGGEMYGVLGNHEWIYTGIATEAAVMGAYLNRYKTRVSGMDANTGNYYVDNIANKIRYIFIQDTNSSYPVSGTIPWLGSQLMGLPDSWSVMVTMHHGYIPSNASLAEYDGATITYNYTSIKAVSRLLAAMRDKQSLTIGDDTFSFNTLTGTRHVIGVFCGHIHHGFLYSEGNEEGVENVAVFRGSTDGLSAATVAVDGMPWFWKDGVVGGEKVVREAGTVTEQCFYAVQIDMTNKMLYITAIGGDHDWQGRYEVV